MPSAIDLCNRALGEIAGQVSISSFSENSPAAFACSLNYDPMRQMLLRAAPWNFARRQLALSQLGTANDGTVAFPWMFSYLYPSDCLRFRYMLQVPNGWPFPTSSAVPQTGEPFFCYSASRRARFLPSGGQDANGNARKILLTNLSAAFGVYSYDCTDVSQFDASFSEALVSLLAEKLVMPVTGNAGLKGTFIQLAKDRVMEARVADGNEGLPTTDSTPDWMTVRGQPTQYYGIGAYGATDAGLGIWSEPWGSLSWGE